MDSVFAQGLFAGQVALVTGGGTGIGLSTAKLLGHLGAQLVLCGRRLEPLQEAERLLRRDAIDVLALTCDIREPTQVEALVKQALVKFGRIDILVNNAGGQFPVAAENLSPRGFEAVVRNNLLGTWNVTHTVATLAFIPQKRGRIVSVTANIKRGFPGMVHTGAARAGVENVTKTIAVEWAQHGIRANAVAPGVIRTSGTDQYPPELLERGRNASVVKRLGTAEEVASLIVYLASPIADFITGQTFSIDGGQSLYGDIYEIG
jgi:citronellol/citronellal dehydrogenase